MLRPGNILFRDGSIGLYELSPSKKKKNNNKKTKRGKIMNNKVAQNIPVFLRNETVKIKQFRLQEYDELTKPDFLRSISRMTACSSQRLVSPVFYFDIWLCTDLSVVPFPMRFI